MSRALFDTHAHIADSRYAEEGVAAEAVLKRASEAGVDKILIPSDSVETSQAALDYREAHNGECGIKLYCSVGVHPHEASSYSDEAEKFILDSVDARNTNGVRAIGEIGLDYHYDFSPRDVQRDVFARQLELAFVKDIPIILHEREATKDCLDIISDFYSRGRLRGNPGVCHCCSMSAESAKIILDMGFYLGFDGPITFKKNRKTPEVAAMCPADRMVIETDSPYLTPEPYRGKTNEPAMVLYVAKRLAEIKNMTEEEIAAVTYENGCRLYELEGE